MNKEEIKDIKLFFSKEFIEYLQEGENTATEISIKTIMQTTEYIEQLENKVKDLERENKVLTHTNKSCKGMLNKQNREKQELIKYLKAKIDENKYYLASKYINIKERIRIEAEKKILEEILSILKSTDSR